jgi:cytochrome c oxidase cbb3-type subunit 4
VSPLWGHLAGVFTVLLMAAFIGVWIWAWLPRHRRPFGRLARLPMEDGAAGPDGVIPQAGEERR